MQTFGSFFKICRSQTGLSLRKYCEKFEIDAAQISRIERDLLPAPKDKEKLLFYAKTLGLKERTNHWKLFFDLASVSNRSIVDEIKTPALIGKLPIFLRTIDNKNLNEEQLNELLEMIRKS
jgi:transcriptional regulator with XRE-family HTH domain